MLTLLIGTCALTTYYVGIGESGIDMMVAARHPVIVNAAEPEIKTEPTLIMEDENMESQIQYKAEEIGRAHV